MNTEQERIESAAKLFEIGIKAGVDQIIVKSRDTMHVIFSALRDQTERENPQALTLEELKKRVDKPVYVVSWDVVHTEGWKIYYGPSRYDDTKTILTFSDGTIKWLSNYGKTWAAYAREPKEGE